MRYESMVDTKGRLMRMLLFTLTCLLVPAFTPSIHAQLRLGTPPIELNSEPWSLETLRLEDRVEYQGLLLSESEDAVEFAEILRLPGRPMSAIIRTIARQQVAKIVRLEGTARGELVERFHRFRHRAAIEADQVSRIRLTPAVDDSDSSARWQYESHAFRLLSTTDDEATRRCIVQIEQLFRAFQNVLPPRVEATRPLSIRLYGSVDDYERHLRRLQLNLDRLAFYSTQENMIVAGCELSSYARQLGKVRASHRRLLAGRATEREQFREDLEGFAARLRQEGVSRGQIKQELALRRAAWKQEEESLKLRIEEADRRNDGAFSQVTERMFRRLRHEAFHAYLLNRVFPHPEQHVPRWLNEGLAQIFEGGFIEAGTLRIDTVDPTRLRQLQRRLRESDAPVLPRLLTADDQRFLRLHDSRVTDDEYLYAWGLAVHLVFHRDLLQGDTLADYVHSITAGHDPQSSFESTVETPLATFESEWRAAMQAIPLP